MIAEYREKAEQKSYYNKIVKPRIDIIEAYARMGLDNNDIAEKLGITTATFLGYLRNDDEKYDKLRLAVERGRELTDILVENALLKRALGYKTKEITKERKIDPDTGDGMLVITKVVQKEIAPDVGACQYWLERRASSRWTVNPIQKANENIANEAILKIADLINNPVPIRTPETYEEQDRKLKKNELQSEIDGAEAEKARKREARKQAKKYDD